MYKMDIDYLKTNEEYLENFKLKYLISDFIVSQNICNYLRQRDLMVETFNKIDFEDNNIGNLKNTWLHNIALISGKIIETILFSVAISNENNVDERMFSTIHENIDFLVEVKWLTVEKEILDQIRDLTNLNYLHLLKFDLSSNKININDMKENIRSLNKIILIICHNIYVNKKNSGFKSL